MTGDVGLIGHIEDDNFIGTFSSNSGITDALTKEKIATRMATLWAMEKNKPFEGQTCPECGSDWIGWNEICTECLDCGYTFK